MNKNELAFALQSRCGLHLRLGSLLRLLEWSVCLPPQIFQLLGIDFYSSGVDHLAFHLRLIGLLIQSCMGHLYSSVGKHLNPIF